MAVISDELYSLLVPLRDERLLVPRACVAEVIRYAPPKNDSGNDSWLRGVTRWRDREVPVVSFEHLLGLPMPSTGGRTRIVIFSPLGGSPACPPYGVLAQGFPQMVRINSEVLRVDEHYQVQSGAPVICQVSMLNETALIPDMEALEERIAAEQNIPA